MSINQLLQLEQHLHQTSITTPVRPRNDHTQNSKGSLHGLRQNSLVIDKVLNNHSLVVLRQRLTPISKQYLRRILEQKQHRTSHIPTLLENLQLCIDNIQSLRPLYTDILYLFIIHLHHQVLFQGSLHRYARITKIKHKTSLVGCLDVHHLES